METNAHLPSLVIGEPKITNTDAPAPAPQDEEQKQKTMNECSPKPYIRCICFLPWFIWVTFTTVLACPVLLCTAGGLCGRDTHGFPTYPSCLADIHCCEYMADCKCKKGNF